MRRFYYPSGTEKHIHCEGCGREYLAKILEHPSCDFCGGPRRVEEVGGCLVVEDEVEERVCELVPGGVMWRRDVDYADECMGFIPVDDGLLVVALEW